LGLINTSNENGKCAHQLLSASEIALQLTFRFYYSAHCRNQQAKRYESYLQPGLRSRSHKELGVVGWSRSRIPKNTWSPSRIFCPTPDVQLDHFLRHTLKFEIPVEMVQFLLKLFFKQISCCVPQFPLILTAKFHSHYVKELESEILEISESEILERSGSESDILPPTPQPYLQRCFLSDWFF